MRNAITVAIVAAWCGLFLPLPTAAQTAPRGWDSRGENAAQPIGMTWPRLCAAAVTHPTSAVTHPTSDAAPCGAPSRFDTAGSGRLTRINRSPGFGAADGTVARERSTRRKVIGALVGATGGFFAGGYTGAWIEGGRCHCDDPGLQGALIGAPMGAVIGAVVGGLYLF